MWFERYARGQTNSKPKKQTDMRITILARRSMIHVMFLLWSPVLDQRKRDTYSAALLNKIINTQKAAKRVLILTRFKETKLDRQKQIVTSVVNQCTAHLYHWLSLVVETAAEFHKLNTHCIITILTRLCLASYVSWQRDSPHFHLLLSIVLRRDCCWPPAKQQSIDILCTPGQQQRRAAAECWNRQTDGRMPNGYIDLVAHIMRAVPIRNSAIANSTVSYWQYYIIHHKRYCAQGPLSQMDPRDALLDASCCTDS